MLLQGHCSPLGRQLRSPPWATGGNWKETFKGISGFTAVTEMETVFFFFFLKKVALNSNILMERKSHFEGFEYMKSGHCCCQGWSGNRVWVLQVGTPQKPYQNPLTSQYDLYKSNMTNGMPQGHFLMFPHTKTLDVYKDTEVCRKEYLFSWQFCRVFRPFSSVTLTQQPSICMPQGLFIHYKPSSRLIWWG